MPKLGSTTTRRRAMAGGLLALLVLAGGLTGCQRAKVGARCKTTAFAEDGGAWILQCRKGRWVRALSKADYARILLSRVPSTTTPGGGSNPGGTNPVGTNPGGPNTTTTVPPVPLVEATQISGGFDHSCARMSNGTLRCWGSGFSGQLGDGQTLSGEETRNRYRAIPVLNLTNAVSVSAGGAFTCAQLADSTAWCWGDNKGGELGGGTVNISTPRQVPGVSNATSVDAGWSHACAVIAGGTVTCWGSNNVGQLGTGATSPTRNAPTEIAGLANATVVGSGEGYSCAIVSSPSGAIRCWGSNNQGQLGNNSTIASPAVVAVSGISDATALSVGRQHACAIVGSPATIRCWGDNEAGQLGDGTTNDALNPVSVSGLPGGSAPVAISAGKDHTCALLANGTMYCWGSNVDGQLGNGTNAASTTPVAVTGLAGVDAMSAGDFHSCAHLPDNTIRCWGSNATGQLGNVTATSSNVAVQVLT